MGQFKQPLMTLFVIFFAAYLLTIIGCAPSSGNNSGPAVAGPVADQNQNPEIQKQPIPLDELRECTDVEFKSLVEWSQILNAAQEQIQNLGPKSNWKKSSPVTQKALQAIQACDQKEFYHELKPCKKTKTQRDVTTPDKIKKTVTGYDAYRINERCLKVENYLNFLGVRPDPNLSQQPSEPVSPQPGPQPEEPGLGTDPEWPQQPPVVNPNPNTPVDPTAERLCTDSEFSKLVSWRSALDRANKNITKLGSPANWKFDTIAIDAAKLATLSCESLIEYHKQQPCRREKAYTQASLSEQCQVARTYYYNFAQRTETLITPKAKLWLDTTPFAGQPIAPGLSNTTYGQCVISNVSNMTVQYSGQKALVKEARVYTESNLQMFVLVTSEGLKLECYGLNYSSAATSLTEVMRLLKAKQTPLNLKYELQ